MEPLLISYSMINFFIFFFFLFLSLDLAEVHVHYSETLFQFYSVLPCRHLWACLYFCFVFLPLQLGSNRLKFDGSCLKKGD